MKSTLNNDRPIREPKDDVLGLASFGSALAISLLKMNPSEGMVISVEGPWGAGKSSAIALATRALRISVLSKLGADQESLEKLNEDELLKQWDEKSHERKTQLIRFNPWNFSGLENLIRAFFKELSAQISFDDEGPLKKLGNSISDYMGPALGVFAAGAAGLVGGIPATPVASTAGRAVGEIVGRAIKSTTSLEKAKDNLSAALREAGHRIIVVIDDIDRLTSLEIRTIFSLVKSLGDLPNILYLLSFDREVVQRVLEQGDDRVDPEFIEKIIQVSLKLPPPWRGSLRQMFIARLSAIFGETSIPDPRRWREVFRAIDPYIETPRDIARIGNTLQVIWPNVEGDVDVADLVAITALQLLDPPIYEIIQAQIEVLTNADIEIVDDRELGEQLNPSAALKPDAARRVMGLLFPRLDKAWNKFPSDNTLYVVKKSHRRICTREYHRNYFAFGRDRRMMSRAEVDLITKSENPASELAAAISRLSKENDDPQHPKIPTLLEQITEVVHSEPALTPSLLKALLDSSDYLIQRGDLIWEMIPTENFDRLELLLRLGTEKLSQEDKAEVLDILKDHGKGLLLRTTMIERDARMHGIVGSDKAASGRALFPRDCIEAALPEIRTQLATACESGAIWHLPKPTRLIFARVRLGETEGVRAWLKRVVEDDSAVVELAKSLPTTSYKSTDLHGQEEVHYLRPSDWRGLLDLGVLVRRLEDLALTSPDAADALCKLKQAIEAGGEQPEGIPQEAEDIPEEG